MHPVEFRGNPISPSTLPPIHALDPLVQEEKAPDSPTIESKLQFQNTNEVERLKKRLEEQDKTITNQAYTMRIQSENNQKIRAKIQEKDHDIRDAKSKNAELETKVVVLERKVHDYQQARTQPVPNEEPQNTEEASFFYEAWMGFKHGVSTVGRFCYNNRRGFEAGFLFTGVILGACFPPWIPLIGMAVMGSIALFEWTTSFFAEH